MSERKTKLVDCNPKWVENYYVRDRVDAIMFECPEGHEGCKHVIPFSPDLTGEATPRAAGAHWERMIA